MRKFLILLFVMFALMMKTSYAEGPYCKPYNVVIRTAPSSQLAFVGSTVYYYVTIDNYNNICDENFVGNFSFYDISKGVMLNDVSKEFTIAVAGNSSTTQIVQIDLPSSINPGGYTVYVDIHNNGYDFGGSHYLGVLDESTPKVQLFVMSLCPYAIQAEQAMKPVVDLLGNRANIQVHFIAQVSGTTPDSVNSLHGINEVWEDLRQTCIQKYYTNNIYWDYIYNFDLNCYNFIKDSASLETCWRNVAAGAGINATQISDCANSTEGVSFLKTDEQLDNQLGIAGSPTLIINSIAYNGDRTPDAYKEAICNAFITKPSECLPQQTPAVPSQPQPNATQPTPSTPQPSPVDKTILLQVLVQTETLKTKFDSLKSASQEISNYYASVNDTQDSTKWSNVAVLFSSGITELDDIKQYIGSVKESPTQDDINQIRDKIRNVMLIVDSALDVILSG